MMSAITVDNTVNSNTASFMSGVYASIGRTFLKIGYARAATELSRLGYYKEAKELTRKLQIELRNC